MQTSDSLDLGFLRRNKLPVIQQSEASECGVACLAMVASYYGSAIDLQQLRTRFSTSIKGITLQRLMQIADQLSLQTRALRVDLEDLKSAQLPCILHWDMSHFVVLRKVSAKGLHIHDPAQGAVFVPFSKASRHFTGVALELLPNEQFVASESKAPRVTLRSLTGRVRGISSAVAHLVVLAILLELVALTTPLLTQLIVDGAIATGDADLLWIIAGALTALVATDVALNVLRSWSVASLAETAGYQWSGNIFGHLLRLPESYFVKRHMGDVVSRFGSVASIKDTLSTVVIEAVFDGVMSIVTLVVLFVYSPVLAALALGFLVSYVALRVALFKRERSTQLEEIAAEAVQQSFFLESVRGVQTIRLHHHSVARTGGFLNLAARWANRKLATLRVSLVAMAGQKTISGINRVSALCVSAYFALRGDFSVGMMIAYLAYNELFFARASKLVDYTTSIRLLSLHGERLADIAHSPIEQFVEGTAALGAENRKIELRDVSFRYADGEPWVVRNFSLTIEPGESVAIVGPSGCGKSTLAKIIVGLLDPQEGRVEFGGEELSRIGKSQLRSRLGVVMQDDQLFSGTIADNIAFGDDNYSIDQVYEAAKAADVASDIEAMPMRYYTLVGDMGSSLSGGQKQRVILARALYRRPQVLVLDEATSHLDVESESRVNSVVSKLDITRIIIAHRRETIATADRVVTMDRQESSFSD